MKACKNFLPIIIVLTFFSPLTSCKINKIHCGAFNYFDQNEGGSEDGNYVVMKDGKKIFGKEISHRNGSLFVDGEKYKIKDTRGFYKNAVYYGTLGNDFAQRIIHGKLNVYYTENSMQVASTNSRTGMTTWSNRQICLHYVQVGEDGKLNPLANQKDIIKYVNDCPAAVAMIDKKNSQIRKAIRKNRNYLNEIFYTYNRGCK